MYIEIHERVNFHLEESDLDRKIMGYSVNGNSQVICVSSLT